MCQDDLDPIASGPGERVRGCAGPHGSKPAAFAMAFDPSKYYKYDEITELLEAPPQPPATY